MTTSTSAATSTSRTSLPCRLCGHPIKFDDRRVSHTSGKMYHLMRILTSLTIVLYSRINDRNHNNKLNKLNNLSNHNDGIYNAAKAAAAKSTLT